MKIGIFNLEPQYRNYALDKIRFYHQQKDDEVEDYFHLNYASYDKIYISSIFTWTLKFNIPNAVVGGSGFNLTTKLPPEIDEVNPHLNYGFTTRGCVRDCKFCIVRMKEGFIKIVCKLKDLWDGKAKLVTLYDNNILALMEHFFETCHEAIDNHIMLDINQGLDFRFLNTEVCDLLHKTPHKEYHFAFDNPSDMNRVKKAISMLQNAGINRSIWYVLVGYNTTLAEDLKRLNFLKEMGQNAFVQRYNLTNKPEYIPLARWANQHHIFHGLTWEQFMNKPENSRIKLGKEVLS